jgi:polyisoprenoid-binding protein YceI
LGRWNVGAGTVAGFRMRQHLLGKSSDIIGRTDTITGTIAVAHKQLTAATFRVDLATIKVNDKPSPQFAKSLDTQQHPSARFTLTQPIMLRSASTPARSSPRRPPAGSRCTGSAVR